MKKLIFFFCLLLASAPAFANHLKGGFFTYEYLGPGITNPNNLRYKVRLTVYMICNPIAGQLDNPVPFTFFNAATNQEVQNVMVSITEQYQLSRTKDEECITGDQRGCYYTIVVYELASIELPPATLGYIISYQRCCRIIGIQNMVAPSNSFGNTYSIRIPGSTTPFDGQTNKSASFLVNDTAVICSGSYFEIPFIAVDPDPGDSLSYFFCAAWVGGGNSGTGGGQSSAAPNPAAPPPYSTIPYAPGFSGTSPLGSEVTINPSTGLISGIAPTIPGEYVVTVCVNEWRQGNLIASSRKELHLKIGDCNSIQANISINNQIVSQSSPQYINCKTYTLNFSNPTTAGITSYHWDFGIPELTNDTSNIASPTYLYPDTGSYTVKLVVNRGQACADSAIALIKLYPGFYPGFTFSGICVNNPTVFTDTSKTDFGTINSWRWDFGDATTNADTSRLKDPSYTYTQTGIKNVSATVTSSLGCVETIFKPVEILTKPPLTVAFSDTLICVGDAVQLQAIGDGNFTWTPNVNITNANTATPTVAPVTTTNYFVELNQNGCINNDTVQVRVVSFVTLAVSPDTTICLTDSVRLSASGNGLRYSWSPAATIANPDQQTTWALPPGNFVYTVTSTIGGCSTTGNINVTTIPYPTANAGADTIICYQSQAQLNASIVGSNFTWTPAGSLNNPNVLNPVARPNATTSYILTVTDVLGCPKPRRDTVVVTVLPKVNAFAGRDTMVVVGQPLQLTGTGGTTYLWSPATGLNDVNIFNPIGLYNGSFDSIRYKLLVFDQAGCFDSAFVNVRIFKTQPQVFVPSAFTPNRDGRNDLFRPIAVGLTKIEYFRVFNRWGQLVFSTTINGHGWDGKINGKEQATGTFVWLVKGVDYLGNSVFEKGTVTLIR